MQLTERRDLRGGHPCWEDAAEDHLTPDPLPSVVDVAIIGAGVMGAMLAHRLTAAGLSVSVVDRRPPARGATAASTALVMWAADVPLSHLVERRGGAAIEAWRRVHRAVLSLAAIVGPHAQACGWRETRELYLAGSLLDERGLRAEAEIRSAAGLPSTFLDADEVAQRFGLPPRAALLSTDTFEVDPVALTLDLLARAQKHGAGVHFPRDVDAIDEAGDGVTLRLAGGASLRARQLVLATGYEPARWYLPESFSISSSYAIASRAGVAPACVQDLMIWEASTPYLYARSTRDGRLIVGGEDEENADARVRDRLLGGKKGILEAKGAALLGMERLSADCAWAASFGSSPDGLPAIGRARNSDAIWLAYGFGGNGISFAALGAEIIAAALAGITDPAAGLFDAYRFEG